MTGDAKTPDSGIAVPVSATSLLPAQIVRLYSDREWEEFVLEWMDGFEPKYYYFDRLGGPGDLGRDIVAYSGEPSSDCELDVYQCKRYDQPLRPTNVWIELGKLCVHTWRKRFRVPRQYRFIAPRGVGTTLADLLANSQALRVGLIENWDKYCRNKISDTETFDLNGDLRTHVDTFPFERVGYVPLHAILQQHRKTVHWHQRFKRDLPTRPLPDQPPQTIQDQELRYISQLLEAYGQSVGAPITKVQDLVRFGLLAEHLNRSRVDFYMADGLNRFYRDQFSEGAFEDVKKQIFDGVIDVASASHADGYARVLATTSQAVLVQLSQTDYVPYIQPGDRKGVCHHLVNDDKLRWVQP